MNRKYEDCFLQKNVVYFKNNMNCLFVVQDVEQCLTLGKETVPEK